ncbi:hypothetical protein PR048_031064 [Dryococelus australis]|uniref:Uncharacterized protein n=1 Tax=Dryococelus australis TaxID=614101 RepID=A0ABQ9G483_9NEOP|nr:hypothetical protein PR048_031064 [Dryococelus australis]
MSWYAETVKCAFKDLRREGKFDDIFEGCNSYVEELDLEPVKTSRVRKPPKKYSSEANCNLESHASMEQYKKLETILMSGEVLKVVDSYPDSLKLRFAKTSGVVI